MASTFSQTLRLELIGDGDQSGIWGQTTNTNLGTLLEQAITGVVNITMLDANYTLSNFNGVSDEARNAVLVVGGTNSQVRDIIAPLVKKLYVVRNSTVGGFAINIRASSGSSVSVPNGGTVWVYCDGTNFNAIGTETVGNFEVNGNLAVTGNTNAVAATFTGNVAAFNYSTAGNVAATGNVSAANFVGAGATITSINASNVTSGTLATTRGGTGLNSFTTNGAIYATSTSALTTGTLPVASGGTGVTTSTGTGSVVLSGSPALTGTPTAPTAIAGTNTTQIATTAYVLANGVPSGAIMMWSGSIVSIPSGWSLCDGSNGTPDLRNRFIVGAGSTYAVGGTGGSADAIVVSHTHTATSTVVDPGHSHTVPGVAVAVASGSTNATPNGTAPTSTAFTGISVSTSIASTGSSGTNANLPPYYALAYIMKL